MPTSCGKPWFPKFEVPYYSDPEYLAATGERVMLSWVGAEDGVDNPITGYEIRVRYLSSEEYVTLGRVYTSLPRGMYEVTATEDAYYYVRTLGTVPGYDSVKSDTIRLTVMDSYPVTPLTLELDDTSLPPGKTTILRWQDAQHPRNGESKIAKVTITAYDSELYPGFTDTGNWVDIDIDCDCTETYGSCVVPGPKNAGESYTYRVTLTAYKYNTDDETGEVSISAERESVLSVASATVHCTVSEVGFPTSATIKGSDSAYVLPDEQVQLVWERAVGGVNNPVLGYDIYRDGEILVSDLSPDTTSYAIQDHAAPGNFCTYKVAAKAEYFDTVYSKDCVVYTYTNPTAPPALNTTDKTPYAGARLMLTWSGAEAGGYNDIVGYNVYVSTEVNGDYDCVAVVSDLTTLDFTSCYVSAPANAGGIYYYRVETVGSYSTSGLSDVYVQITAVANPGGDDADITVIVRPPARKRRGMIFGEYDTAVDGWTLCEWEFPEPEYQTNYVEVPGRKSGPLDLSTALTGGDPRYGSRELSARFELSEGTRDERNEVLSRMVNELSGRRVDIVLPDDNTRYVTGRLSVHTDYSDLAHASVIVTAVCAPWRYSKTETVREVYVAGTQQTIVLSNNGRYILSPTVTVTGNGSLVGVFSGTKHWRDLTPGEYKLPDFTLPHGNTAITCYGEGVITFRYREAIL